VPKQEPREQVQQIPMSEIHPFRNHPFKVLDDELMQQTIDSIMQVGILNPAIIRPDPEGGYEMVAGHRRLYAADLAGLKTIPAIVRNLTDDEAVILMVDSNLQRETISPMERAQAYKMKLEALKHQGKKVELQADSTSPQLGEKSSWAVSIVANDANASRSQVQRFIRLTELLPEVQEKVESKEIAFSPAVELSYVHRTNNGKRISQYTCSQYTKVPCGTLCKTQHRINEDVVLSLVSEMLKAIAEYAKHDRAEFVRVVQEAQSSQQTTEVRKQRTRLATAKQRVSELEVLLCKIYEDNILGKLSDSRYATLDAQYEKEQSELTAEISVLEKAVKSYEKHEKDADRFIALIDKYENFDKLTIAMLNEFIEKILVHERDRKGSIQTTQEVEIYFNFVGRFVPPAFGEVELIPEELEEIRKREERKDRLHQNYLKRKASGAQKRYEDKIKKRKKAEIEAKKAAIRAEDIAKGVFVPVSSLPQREPMKGVQTA